MIEHYSTHRFPEVETNPLVDGYYPAVLYMAKCGVSSSYKPMITETIRILGDGIDVFGNVIRNSENRIIDKIRILLPYQSMFEVLIQDINTIATYGTNANTKDSMDFIQDIRSYFQNRTVTIGEVNELARSLRKNIRMEFYVRIKTIEKPDGWVTWFEYVPKSYADKLGLPEINL